MYVFIMKLRNQQSFKYIINASHFKSVPSQVFVITYIKFLFCAIRGEESFTGNLNNLFVNTLHFTNIRLLCFSLLISHFFCANW